MFIAIRLIEFPTFASFFQTEYKAVFDQKRISVGRNKPQFMAQYPKTDNIFTEKRA
jgi:hypothetical protein